jgi:hypothetical protein
MIKPQPWSPADATHAIRKLGSDARLKSSYTLHFLERLTERGLIIGDALYVLRHGFVYDPAESSTQPNLYRYRIETKTPNSNNRSVRIVVIPDSARCWIKFVTAMWVDEVPNG